MQSVGRLDYRSEGLLILTNDGDLSLALSHPKYSVEKTYAVLVSSVFTVEDAEKLKKGIELDDGPAKAISVKIGSKEKLGNSTGQWIELVVTEGRNRLVRRMLEALGLSVVRLVRVAIGDIRLPAKLEPGKMRPISEVEAKYLLNLKKNMLGDTPKKTTAVLSKDVLEKRKLKRKVTLNDLDYAREAERREKRSSLIAQLRKKELAEKSEKRHTWKVKEEINTSHTKAKNKKENIYKSDNNERISEKSNLKFKPKPKSNATKEEKKSDSKLGNTNGNKHKKGFETDNKKNNKRSSPKKTKQRNK